MKLSHLEVSQFTRLSRLCRECLPRHEDVCTHSNGVDDEFTYTILPLLLLPCKWKIDSLNEIPIIIFHSHMECVLSLLRWVGNFLDSQLVYAIAFEHTMTLYGTTSIVCNSSTLLLASLLAFDPKKKITKPNCDKSFEQTL